MTALPLDPRRAAVIAEAETWRGTPFLHATMKKGRGVDCIMILVACFRAGGVLAEDVDPRVRDGEYKPYPRQWFMHHSEERYLIGMMQHAREVKHPQPGDVGLWKFGRCYSHGGILVTPFIDHPNPYQRQGELIHAFWRSGTVARDQVTLGDLLWRAGGHPRECKWFDPYP